MSKNRIEMNNNLFARILSALEYHSPGASASMEGDRFIHFSTDKEMARAMRLYIDSFKPVKFYVDGNVSWLKIRTDRGSRLLFCGPQLDITTSFDVRAANAPEFLFFADYFDLYPNTTADNISEVIGSGSRSDPDYQGHEHSQLASLFDTIYVIEGDASENKCISDIIARIYVAKCFANADFNARKYFDKVRASDWISCDFEQSKMVSSLNIYSPIHFLSHYWLLERFFFEAAARPLFAKLKPSLDEGEFYRALEAELDWRPKELTALKMLIQDAFDAQALNEQCTVISSELEVASIAPGNHSEFLAKEIYSFRNGLVHSRHVSKKPTIQEIRNYTCVLYDVATQVFISRSSTAYSSCSCGSAHADQ